MPFLDCVTSWLKREPEEPISLRSQSWPSRPIETSLNSLTLNQASSGLQPPQSSMGQLESRGRYPEIFERDNNPLKTNFGSRISEPSSSRRLQGQELSSRYDQLFPKPSLNSRSPNQIASSFEPSLHGAPTYMPHHGAHESSEENHRKFVATPDLSELERSKREVGVVHQKDHRPGAAHPLKTNHHLQNQPTIASSRTHEEDEVKIISSFRRERPNAHHEKERLGVEVGLNKKIEEQRDLLRSLQDEKIRWEIEKKKSEEEVSSLNRQLKDKDDQLSSVEHEKSQALKEKDGLSTELVKYKEENLRNNREIERLRGEVANLSQSKRLLETENNRLNALVTEERRLVKEILEKQARHEAQIEKLEAKEAEDEASWRNEKQELDRLLYEKVKEWQQVKKVNEKLKRKLTEGSKTQPKKTFQHIFPKPSKARNSQRR